MRYVNPAALALLAAAVSTTALAQESDLELAKKLANPVAGMISVPLQNNYDCCYGPGEGYRYTLNIQPVVPVSVGENWNMIVRTIVPVVFQEAPAPGTGNEAGFSDVTQSFFFTPKQEPGFVWAIGPALLYPLGGEDLGTGKWAAGPTALLLKQTGHRSVGILANHLWSYAGDSQKPDVSQTFLQPFFSYTFPNTTGVGVNTEASYNWETKTWVVPVNFTLSHMYKVGAQRLQLTGGVKYYVSPEDGAPEWGLRFVATFLFPK